MSRCIAALSPAEVMRLAIEVERSNAARFATLRDCFLHHDPMVFALFDELRQQEQENAR